MSCALSKAPVPLVSSPSSPYPSVLGFGATCSSLPLTLLPPCTHPVLFGLGLGYRGARGTKIHRPTFLERPQPPATLFPATFFQSTGLGEGSKGEEVSPQLPHPHPNRGHSPPPSPQTRARRSRHTWGSPGGGKRAAPGAGAAWRQGRGQRAAPDRCHRAPQPCGRRRRTREREGGSEPRRPAARSSNHRLPLPHPPNPASPTPSAAEESGAGSYNNSARPPDPPPREQAGAATGAPATRGARDPARRG